MIQSHRWDLFVCFIEYLHRKIGATITHGHRTLEDPTNRLVLNQAFQGEPWVNTFPALWLSSFLKPKWSTLVFCHKLWHKGPSAWSMIKILLRGLWMTKSDSEWLCMTLGCSGWPWPTLNDFECLWMTLDDSGWL